MALKNEPLSKHPEPATPEILSNTWYWYKGQPVFCYEAVGILYLRGYNFDTKHEWRIVANSLDSDLKKIPT